MRSLKSYVAILVLCLSPVLLLLAGCSNQGEDVRVTLCKDIVYTQVGSSVTVTGTDTATKGRRQAEVRVRYSDQGSEAQAVCYYDHDAVEDTADHLSDPLSAFATSPSEVIIDGRRLSPSGLGEAVKQAMLKQGRELVDQAKKGIEDVLQR